MKKLIYIVFFIILSSLLINCFYDIAFFVALCSAIFLPICFIFFFRKIDIFEPERYRDLFFTFCLSVVTLSILFFLVLPFWHALFGITSEPDSFLQTLLGVALIEEVFKILPVLYILKTTKFINEPIDYIIYASISALAFSFLENLDYIYMHLNDSTSIIAFRNIEPLLMHMCTSSFLGFGLFCYKITSRKKYIVLGLLFAVFGHAIYNQLCDIGFGFTEMIPLVIMVTLYAKLIHSLLNISPFYEKEKVKDLKGTGTFLFLILACIIVFNFFAELIFAETVDVPVLLVQSIISIILILVLYSRIWNYLKIDKGKFIAFGLTKKGKKKTEFKTTTELREAIVKFYESEGTNNENL